MGADPVHRDDRRVGGDALCIHSPTPPGREQTGQAGPVHADADDRPGCDRYPAGAGLGDDRWELGEQDGESVRVSGDDSTCAAMGGGGSCRRGSAHSSRGGSRYWVAGPCRVGEGGKVTVFQSIMNW